MKDLAAQAGRSPIFIHLSDDDVTFVNGGDHRLIQVLRETGAAMVYSDFLTPADGGDPLPHRLIDCQFGAIRDDFDFGRSWLLTPP